MSEAPTEFDPSYVAGLLDAAGRVRFNVSRQDDDSFTVRPQLRIFPHGNEFRTAAVGSFLDDGGYQYQFVQMNDAPPYFILRQRSDFEDLHEYLAGESATLVRELEFVMTTFAEEFDFGILSPKETYRFLLTRDALRDGWRPRSPNFLTADDIATEFGLTPRDVETPELPIGPLRTEEDIEWVAGFVDGNGRFRPSVAKDSETRIGYLLSPNFRIALSGRHPATLKNLISYFEQHDLEYSDISQQPTRRITFASLSSVRDLFESAGPHLLVLSPFVGPLLEDIFPRFQAKAHTSKEGFYHLLEDMMEIAEATYSPFNPDKYDLEFFYEQWADDPDFDVDA